MTENEKKKAKELLREESRNDSGIALEEILNVVSENYSELNGTMSDLKDSLEPLTGLHAAIQNMAGTHSETNNIFQRLPELLAKTNGVFISMIAKLVPKETDLSPLLKAMEENNKMLRSKDGEMHHVKSMDATNAGFKKLEEAILSSNKDLAKTFYDAVQPLVDQNVEKLKIMKSGGGKHDEKNIVVSGGGSGNVRGLPHAYDIHEGTLTVVTAGAALPLVSTPTMCNQVTITAHESNTGTIVFGGSGVVAALVGRKGTPLYASQSATININDVSKVYVDSTMSGDKVTFSYLS